MPNYVNISGQKIQPPYVWKKNGICSIVTDSSNRQQD